MAGTSVVEGMDATFTSQNSWEAYLFFLIAFV